VLVCDVVQFVVVGVGFFGFGGVELPVEPSGVVLSGEGGAGAGAGTVVFSENESSLECVSVSPDSSTIGFLSVDEGGVFDFGALGGTAFVSGTSTGFPSLSRRTLSLGGPCPTPVFDEEPGGGLFEEPGGGLFEEPGGGLFEEELDDGGLSDEAPGGELLSRVALDAL